MFSGIVERTGRVERLTVGRDGGRIRIACGEMIRRMRAGESIAVDGTCLTIVAGEDPEEWFEADLSVETLRRTVRRVLAEHA